MVPEPETVHDFVPVLGVLATIVLHVAPLSRDSSIFMYALAATLTVVHVMACELPAAHVSPPTGAVRVTAGAGMVNAAPLVSDMAGVVYTETLTSASAVAGPVTVHDLLPVLVPVPMSVQVTPLSRESSNFINVVGRMLTEVQVMVCDVPIGQTSPPIGAVSVNDGGGGPTMVKSAALLSLTAGLAATETRTRA